MRFVPHHALEETPHVIVDGAATPHTRLVLSHWPDSGTPEELLRDTSAEIVLDWLASGARAEGVEVVSNDHFDEDGLLGVWAVLHPGEALERRAKVAGAARAGDFGTYATRDAARFAFAVSKLAEQAESRSEPYPVHAGKLYLSLLPRVRALLDDIAAHEDLWREEDARLEASLELEARGEVRIEEHPDLDLAIVHLPALARSPVHRFTQPREAAVHPMVIHNATERNRLILVSGDACELQYRYESWVQYRSYRPLPRVDLTPLAEELGEGWRFDGVHRITPRLHGPPIDPARFIERVTSALRLGSVGT